MMKQELNETSLVTLRQRFHSFHDSLVHSIHLGLFSRTKPRDMIVTVHAIDGMMQPNAKNDRWVNIVFEIQDLEYFVVKKTENYDFGLVMTLSIGFFDGNIYFNFYGADGPSTRETFKERPPGSEFIVAGKRCYWWEEPYQERV